MTGVIASSSSLNFVWFWTFWHWSAEGSRSGALLRSPVQGIGSHWDEWFTHEASETDRETIDAIGRSKTAQRQFILWLARRWASEAKWRADRPPIRYTLTQLARVAPFDRWEAFDSYRTAYGTPGITAIVIDEDSAGESTDVRHVESLILPADEDSAAHAMVPEGFHSEAGDLNDAREAAMSLLSGRGLLVLLGLWIATGRRPYSDWLRVSLLLGWIVTAVIIATLLIGFDPGSRLDLVFGLLTGLWVSLILTSVAVSGVLARRAWLAGREWRNRIRLGQTRLRMNGGLALQGGSAGLPFCLNTLLAAYRSRPRPATDSWLWEQFFRNMRNAEVSWAATGVVSPGGHVESVALQPKIRACLRHPEITDLIAPRQPDSRQKVIDGLASSSVRKPRAVASAGMTRAFASETPRLRSHRCRHVAQSILAIGRLESKAQLSANILALAVSIVMLAALPDILNVLVPPAPPEVVKPASSSPYYLWVSLDTGRPRAFRVAFESGFWSNRRANVERYSDPDGSVRAEIRVSRVDRQTTVDDQDGTVWIERRRAFLTREYEPGERVGTYSLSYISRLGHE